MQVEFKNKTMLEKVIIVVIVIVGLICLYMVLAVNAKIKEQKEFGRNEPDSIRINDSIYHFKR